MPPVSQINSARCQPQRQDVVLLDESVFDVRALDAADPAVAHGVAADDVLPALGQRRPGGIELVADVDADGVALPHHILFDDPMVASHRGQRALLRSGKAIAAVLDGETLYADVTKAEILGREDHAAGGDLDLRPVGIGVCERVKVQRQAILLDPVRARNGGQVLMAGNLPEPLAILEDQPPAKRVGGFALGAYRPVHALVDPLVGQVELGEGVFLREYVLGQLCRP